MSWPHQPLKRLVKVHYGKALKETDRVKAGQWPVYGSSGKVGNHDSALTTEPTIIIGRKGSVGEITYAPKGGWTIDTAFYTEIRDPGALDLRFLFYALKKANLVSHTITTSIPGINRENIYATKIPLPPLPEQKRIAAILDKADAIRRKRQAAIKLAADFSRATFLDMFGDPATNPRGWKVKTFGDIASKFSDGPFGSNLKSSHYVNTGVRVVRLQNIGTGQFIDKDKAFISEYHFNSLAKHECNPGDVLIGTLGEPNLRACILPSYISKALNKADCIQFRPNINHATSEYVCSLINHPGILTLAFHLMHGQTRTRVSMGTLRELLIPVPPLFLQKTFTKIYYQMCKLLVHHNTAEKEEDLIFNSLTQRAFRGEL